GTQDAFHFVYQPLTGDGQIVVRVTSLQNTNGDAKAGLMMRESLAPDATHVILDVEPPGYIEFMTRSTTGALTQWLAGGYRQPPAWLKLERSGSTITGSVSDDGVEWRQVGTTTSGM